MSNQSLTEAEREGLIEAVLAGDEADYVERLIAERLRVAQAQAWEQGWRDRSSGDHAVIPPNPYGLGYR